MGKLGQRGISNSEEGGQEGPLNRSLSLSLLQEKSDEEEMEEKVPGFCIQSPLCKKEKGALHFNSRLVTM